MPEHHVVVSFGDVFRQSGYRTKVLGELLEYERHGPLAPVLIAFDRDAGQLADMDLGGVEVHAHGRRSVHKLYSSLWRIARQGRIRTVHAHNLYSAALALSARPFFGYRVLVEIHGRIPEEYVLLGKGGGASYWMLKRLESWVMKSADHIIPISEKLKDYLAAQYRLSPSKLTVIPDCADPRVFRWDPARRDAARKRLDLEEKFVCVHLGSVFIWYDPGLIVKVFRRIRERLPQAHLLVVTEDAVRTRAFLQGQLSADEFSVHSVAHKDVPELLNAADLGFLLLRSTPNIAVASPAKFSEYLNSGLPVLITPHVGDFSALVEREHAGAIVSDDGDFDFEYAGRVLQDRAAAAQRSVTAGRQLTWDALRPAWTAAMQSLTRSTTATD